MQVPEFLTTLWRARATAIMRSADQQRAASAMEAAVKGGFSVVEFTLTTPGAYELITEFAKKDGLSVGAGTVMTVEQANRAVDAGARFLVSPVVDEAVIKTAVERGVAMMPGTSTPSEMWRAHQAGASLMKLFPVAASGPDWIRSVRGPMPFLRIVPTNGVDEENCDDYIEAGAFAVGFVRSLFSPQEMAENRFDWVEARARAILAAINGPERPDTPPNAPTPS